MKKLNLLLTPLLPPTQLRARLTQTRCCLKINQAMAAHHRPFPSHLLEEPAAPSPSHHHQVHRVPDQTLCFHLPYLAIIARPEVHRLGPALFPAAYPSRLQEASLRLAPAVLPPSLPLVVSHSRPPLEVCPSPRRLAAFPVFLLVYLPRQVAPARSHLHFLVPKVVPPLPVCTVPQAEIRGRAGPCFLIESMAMSSSSCGPNEIHHSRS